MAGAGLFPPFPIPLSCAFPDGRLSGPHFFLDVAKSSGFSRSPFPLGDALFWVPSPLPRRLHWTMVRPTAFVLTVPFVLGHRLPWSRHMIASLVRGSFASHFFGESTFLALAVRFRLFVHSFFHRLRLHPLLGHFFHFALRFLAPPWDVDGLTSWWWAPFDGTRFRHLYVHGAVDEIGFFAFFLWVAFFPALVSSGQVPVSSWVAFWYRGWVLFWV